MKAGKLDYCSFKFLAITTNDRMTAGYYRMNDVITAVFLSV